MIGDRMRQLLSETGEASTKVRPEFSLGLVAKHLAEIGFEAGVDLLDKDELEQFLKDIRDVATTSFIMNNVRREAEKRKKAA